MFLAKRSAAFSARTLGHKYVGGRGSVLSKLYHRHVVYTRKGWSIQKGSRGRSANSAGGHARRQYETHRCMSSTPSPETEVVPTPSAEVNT